MSNTLYEEFHNRKLAEVYDTFCQLGEDGDFWVSEASKKPGSTIIDLGCGTGLLTLRLAEQGHRVIGVEPAAAMLELAKRKRGSEKVTWILGYAEDVPATKVDLILMTSHVAQFFLTDEQWVDTLKTLKGLLKPDGRLIFDSRNPLVKTWEAWTSDRTRQTKASPRGPVETWTEVVQIGGPRVRHNIHYIFKDTGEELTSHNELIYRSKDELINSLNKAGLAVEAIYGDWDKSEATDTSKEHIVAASPSSNSND